MTRDCQFTQEIFKMKSKKKIHAGMSAMFAVQILFLGGCAILQSPEERIPERSAFFTHYLKQDSIAELRKSFQAHYSKVSRELAKLEELQSREDSDKRMIARKIEDHQRYLLDMDEALFLCPEHKSEFIVSGKESCKNCKGSGKTFWGKTCPECSGTGVVAFRRKEYRKCAVCGKLYHGSILGKTLHENY